MRKSSSENFVKITIKIMLFAGLAMVSGSYVDSWWHVNIGRDTFWEPPHMIIYSCLLTILLSFTYLFFKGNLSNSKWISVIGFLLIITAAPFDEWWHQTYPGSEVGLGLISPPHIEFAIGGALAGFGILRLVADKSKKYPELRKYLLVYLFAGYMLIMQAIGLIDPSNPTILGYLGSALFASVPVGFYIFTKKCFSNIYVKGVGFGEGLAKALIEGHFLHFPALVLSSLFIAKLKKLKDSYSSCYIIGAIAGAIMGSYLLFYINNLDPLTILIRVLIGSFSGAIAGALANFAARRLFKDYNWKNP